VKDTKVEADYGPGHVHHHCGPVFHDDKFYCRFFNPSPGWKGTCDKVKGDIEPDHGCKLYERVNK
jgi:uncharacterized C2H2 Zn-finger protein